MAAGDHHLAGEAGADTINGRRPATLRVWIGNVTDQFFWEVSASNSFGLSDGRRCSALVFVDI